MFGGHPSPQPLSPGLERVARDRVTMKDELRNAVKELIKSDDHVVVDGDRKRSRQTIVKEITMLLLELAAFGLLRRAADSLDYLIRTYRTQPGDLWRAGIHNTYKKVVVTPPASPMYTSHVPL